VKTRCRLDSARCGFVAWPGSLLLPAEVPTSSAASRLLPLSVVTLLLLPACGPWQRVGTPEAQPAPVQQVAAIFNPGGLYRSLGFVTGAGDIPFVGNARLLASREADTAMAMIALSMENRYFAFQRDSSGFAASYRVELMFRQGTLLVRQVVQDERVVVGTFAETQRAEESIIYQDFIPIPAGSYDLSIVVRDRNGPNEGRYEGSFAVPRLEPPAISTPIPVYRARLRTDVAVLPDLVANPRSTVDYGTDSLRFYVEAYGLPAGSVVVASVLDSAGAVGWADSTRLDSARALQPIVFAVAPTRLSLGRQELRVSIAGGDVVATAPFLVAFSGQWIVVNFDQMISLLRYFTSQDTLSALAHTPPADRAAAWRKFWRDTDPNLATPENEALNRYFARLQAANELFRDEGMPGWLTDRGEVYCTLGPPDQDIDQHPDYHGRGRTIMWQYDRYNLTLYFVDDAGFGRLRMDPGSRLEFQQTVNRVRRGA
jgi:GWxTD domain-containing protein